MHGLRAVLFDMDGVLIDSGGPHHESWRVVAERHGVHVTAERFHQTFGRPSRDIIRMLWGRVLTDDEIRQIDDEKEEVYRELVRDCVPLMPGCRAALERLRDAGLTLAVATSGPPENLAHTLATDGLAAFFTATVNGREVAHGKPAPDCFLLAAQRVGVPPAECVVIEDSPAGIEAGRAAGMRVLGLVGTHPAERLLAAGADRALDSLDQLTLALLNAL